MLRIYNRWTGNPNGTKEDTKRCIEEVPYEGRSVLFHQCLKKKGYGPKFEYCKQHAKKLALR